MAAGVVVTGCADWVTRVWVRGEDGYEPRARLTGLQGTHAGLAAGLVLVAGPKPSRDRASSWSVGAGVLVVLEAFPREPS